MRQKKLGRHQLYKRGIDVAPFTELHSYISSLILQVNHHIVCGLVSEVVYSHQALKNPQSFQSCCRLRNLCVHENLHSNFPSFDLSLHLSSLQHGFQPMARSSLPSSSPSIPHSDSTSVKGNGGGGGEEGSERKRKRATDGGEGGSKGEEAAAGGGVEGDGGGGQGVSSLSIAGSTSSTQAPLALAQQDLTHVLGAVCMAPTMVTNVVRPITSTPIPIASKPVEGAVTLSSLPQDKKATLLIGGGGPQQLPITAGGGYLSSSSSPSPVSVTPLGGSGLVTNLLVGGSFPAAQPVQLLTPQPPTQTPLPVLQPQFHPTATTSSLTPPTGPKSLAQVQYILPTESPSSPQLTHQQILSLPTNAALANGVHSGAGTRVSPGTRGETETNDWLTQKDSFHWSTEN